MSVGQGIILAFGITFLPFLFFLGLKDFEWHQFLTSDLAPVVLGPVALACLFAVHETIRWMSRHRIGVAKDKERKHE